jgi:hypothetical protein
MKKRMACALALATGTGLVLGAGSQQALADPTSTVASSGLQVSIVPPNSLTSDTSATLDINYRGGTIRSVELYVDNTKVFRKSVKFSITHGDFNLKIDNSLLTEGDHDLMVVAVDADGSTASSSIRVHVAGPEVDGIAQFAYPRRNAMVQNVVPVELKLDPNIKAPYVAFLLDNDFLAIRNYAPYVYNWDSTKIPDGPHTIGVEVYDSSTEQLLKKMTVQVIVKNVGGFTTIQPTIPTISANTHVSGVRSIIGAAISEPVSRFAEENGILNRTSIQPASGYSLRSVEPQITSLFVKPETRPSSILPTFEPTPSFAAEPAPSVSVNVAPHATRPSPAESFVPVMPALMAEPVISAAPTLDVGRISRVHVRPMRAGNIAARPQPRFEAEHTVKPILVAQYLAPTSNYIRSHVASLIKTFDIAFNNARIAFDVQPRVEKGMPLAPFRAIFEHTGGSVQWFGKSQTVRAISANRQIEFKIGQDTATVNNHVIKLAYRPYVEHGRTIVPISFVRDAMNVKVTYDARLGHLNINDKQ